MKKLKKHVFPTNHIFAKLMVFWCVLCATGFSYYALRILSRTGHDPADLLGVILSFFGGELLLLCLKTVLNDNGKRGKKREKSDPQEGG